MTHDSCHGTKSLPGWQVRAQGQGFCQYALDCFPWFINFLLPTQKYSLLLFCLFTFFWALPALSSYSILLSKRANHHQQNLETLLCVCADRWVLKNLWKTTVAPVSEQCPVVTRVETIKLLKEENHNQGHAGCLLLSAFLPRCPHTELV